MNELADEIMQHGRHCMQLIRDLTDISNLLFAHDVILVSDIVHVSQNQVNII